ncbi:MAG: ferredoxin [Patescibacteria group bacterium]
MKIVHDRSKCIGCGSCVALCADFFEIAEDGRAHLLKSQLDEKLDMETREIEEAECAEEAVNICPVQCIQLTN